MEFRLAINMILALLAPSLHTFRIWAVTAFWLLLQAIFLAEVFGISTSEVDEMLKLRYRKSLEGNILHPIKQGQPVLNNG